MLKLNSLLAFVIVTVLAGCDDSTVSNPVPFDAAPADAASHDGAATDGATGEGGLDAAPDAPADAGTG